MKRNWWMGYKSRIDPLVSSSFPSSPQLRSNIVNLSPCRDKATVDSVSGVFPIVLESPSQQLARTCRRVETRCDWSGDSHPRLPTFSREEIIRDINCWKKTLTSTLVQRLFFFSYRRIVIYSGKGENLWNIYFIRKRRKLKIFRKQYSKGCWNWTWWMKNIFGQFAINFIVMRKIGS